jgi:hypothetical protein
MFIIFCIVVFEQIDSVEKPATMHESYRFASMFQDVMYKNALIVVDLASRQSTRRLPRRHRQSDRTQFAFDRQKSTCRTAELREADETGRLESTIYSLFVKTTLMNNW